MSDAVIVVTTANRPEIFNRCVASAVSGCAIAREAHWLVLDDSLPDWGPLNRNVVRLWKRLGLKMTYIDGSVEARIAAVLGQGVLREAFVHLVARPSAHRVPGARNLAFLASLSLKPQVIFFIDDDVVHRHEPGKTCFFHWCTSCDLGGSFVATPRKRGIEDMDYSTRLTTALDSENWAQFISGSGIGADPETWYSTQNPLWQSPDDGSAGIGPSEVEKIKLKDAVSTALIAICDRGGDWLPFPGGHNEDVHWSILQAALYGTPLIQVRTAFVQHLPKSIGHPSPDSIVSQFMAAALRRALRKLKPDGAPSLSALADELQDVLVAELKKEVFSLLKLELTIRKRARACVSDSNVVDALLGIERTLADAKKRLESVDTPLFLYEWLNDMDVRREMFSMLRRDDGVQAEIARIVIEASA